MPPLFFINCLPDNLRAMRTTLGVYGNLAQTLGAFFGGWIRGRLLVRAGNKHVHRLDHKEKDRRSHQQKRDNRVNEIADHELTPVERECKSGKIRNLGDGGDQRRKQISNQRVDHRPERSADNDTNRQINDIPPEQELFKFF